MKMSGISLQKNTGEVVAETEAKVYVEWKIHDFFSLRPELDHRFESPVFQFLGALWCLQVNPNGERRHESFGWTGLYLKKVHSATKAHTVKWDMGILDENGSTYESKNFVRSFVGNEKSSGTFKMVERSSLLRDMTTILCQGCMKFFLQLEGADKVNVGAVSPKIKLEDGHLEKPDNLLTLLSRNFKELLASQKRSDVILKVKDREFPVHKIVLETRSSVFAKMFEHNMLENRNGIVDIPDFEPQIIQYVLCYIYSGEIEGFSPENICQLYKAADKYDLEKLKQKCAEYIESNVTLENVCEVLLLSDMYQETKMKVSAQDFIVQNKQKVLTGESWKFFVSENKSIAYETLESILLSYTIM